MSVAQAAFLVGAGGRLLRPSIPLRFFGAAVVYHLLAWLVLAACAQPWLEFRGGLGWPLAALHLFTLGVLGMTAIGASAQLLPVATRQQSIGEGPLAAVWWLYTPGVALLAFGMGAALPHWLAAGAAAVALALGVWAVLMVRHLLGARGMPGMRAHVWTALASLAALLATALSLTGTWLGWSAPSREGAQALHVLFAPFGFMGMLALGLAYVLVPMFALADAPSEREQLAAWALAVAALLCGAAAVFGTEAAFLHAAAIALGTCAMLLHVWLMARTLRHGMRRSQGRALTLVKIGWGGLALSVACAAVLWFDLPLPRAAGWFGWSLGLWLLSMLFGMLQRILPFLGSMHAPAVRRRAPTPSALTHEPALRVHFACHLGAFAGLALALLSDSAIVAVAACACGAAGALAYGWFYLNVLRRMRPPADFIEPRRPT